MGKIKFEVGKKYFNTEKVFYELCTKRTYQSVYFGKDRYNIKGKGEEFPAEYTNLHTADNFEKTVVVKKRTYQFRVNLSKDNVLGDFTWDFQVLADTQSEAEKILENYLSEPAQTGLKYKKCVGIKSLSSEEILIMKN